MAESTQNIDGDIVNLNVEKKRKSESLWQTAMRRIRSDYLTLTAIGVLVLLALFSFVLAPMISSALGVSYTATQPTDKLLPMGTSIGDTTYLLGTDQLGRDMLSRLLYGGRVSLFIGFTVAFLSGFIGVSLGLVSGFYQGSRYAFIDDALMWFITTLTSIPTLMLLILIASVLNPSIPTLIFVLTITSWAGTMRLIRGETLSARNQEYVISAQALGASPVRIMFVHILPNTLSILLTDLAINIGTVILVESALSFLGLGVRPPEPSWGNMLTAAQNFFREAPQMSILPGLLITITVLCLYLLGDGLRDAFDPRSAKGK